MKKITKEWLQEQGACWDGTRWFLDQRATQLNTIVMKLLKENHANWANWVLVRHMTHIQRVQYACFAAERVLVSFERLYPNDKRPREAIEAARRFAENPTTENRTAARSAARSATESAARSAARPARSAWSAWSAQSAWYAAQSAWYAARSAQSARSAEFAILSATRSAEFAIWSATQSATNWKIVVYGLELLV